MWSRHAPCPQYSSLIHLQSHVGIFLMSSHNLNSMGSFPGFYFSVGICAAASHKQSDEYFVLTGERYIMQVFMLIWAGQAAEGMTLSH